LIALLSLGLLVSVALNVTLLSRFPRQGDAEASGIFERHDREGRLVQRAYHRLRAPRAYRVDQYDKQGLISQVWHDVDQDGWFEKVENHHQGVKVSEAFDADGDGVLEGWRIFEQGKLVRELQDQNGDGLADQASD
jgi:hypothetical protein